MRGRAWESLGRVKVVNHHTFTAEKKAQRKRRLFNQKYNIKSSMF
jgi:hypothetical protein